MFRLTQILGPIVEAGSGRYDKKLDSEVMGDLCQEEE